MQGAFRPEVIEHIESRYGEVLIKEWMFTKALEDMNYNDLVLWGYESHQNGIKLSNNYNEISFLHSKLQQTFIQFWMQNRSRKLKN